MNQEYIAWEPNRWLDVEALVRDAQDEEIWRPGRLRGWSRPEPGTWVGHVQFASPRSSSLVAMLKPELIRGASAPGHPGRRITPPGTVSPHTSQRPSLTAAGTDHDVLPRDRMPMTPPDVTATSVHTYRELVQLLTLIEHQHPEVSAPLRLDLQRARRDGQLGHFDTAGFRSAIAAVSP